MWRGACGCPPLPASPGSLVPSPTLGTERTLACAAAPAASGRSGPRNPRGRCHQCLRDLKLESLGELRLQLRRGIHGHASKVADRNLADACERNQLPSQPVPCMVGQQACGHGRQRSARRAGLGRCRWSPRSLGRSPTGESRGSRLATPAP